MQASASSTALLLARLEVEFAQLSDPGRIRQNNEDYFGYVQPRSPLQAQSHGWLFVVADGVGGQQFGEIASRTAVESILANFSRSVGGESHAALLRRLVQAANHAVYEGGHSVSPVGVPMATTIVACTLRYDRAVVAHVGDSRCYLVRNGHATALTRDHSVSSEQIRLGLITAKEGAESGNRHLLSRSLGNDLFVSVEIGDHSLIPGDTLLLSSDGLHNSVGASDIAELLSPVVDLNVASRNLVALANERDGADNITVQVVRVRSVERIGIYRGRPYRLR
jgi:protein phosphatase